MRNRVRNILDHIGRHTDISFRIVFPDGSTIQSQETDPVVTVHFKTRLAELRVALFGHVGLLESYFDQSVDIDGDIAAAFRAAMDSGFDRGTNLLVRLRNRWHEWRFSNRSLAQARANANYHCALGTDFYRLWLDRVGMMYTCAYWKEGTTSLEEAQWNKMEHVCRKIRLQPGESVADIGCGSP